MIAGHIHNSRCMWIKTLGKEHGIAVPRAVNRHKVEPKELIPALGRSSRGMISLLTLGCDRGGAIPGSSSYTWRNLPLDVGHVLTYFVAHEGHHRGQIVMLARQLGYRLPAEITNGLWLWSRRAREARDQEYLSGKPDANESSFQLGSSFACLAPLRETLAQVPH
jgi:uncharacterized damage-inducible protein DinB